MKKHLLAFGNPVYDVIITPFLQVNGRVLSGCSTNACLAVVKLGESATLVGSVGPDFRSQIEADLAGRGVSYHLGHSEQTGGFKLVYDRSGNRDLSVLGVAAPVPAHDNGRRPVSFVLLGPILGEIDAAFGSFVREKFDAPVLLDPQGLLRCIVDGNIVHQMTEDFAAVARVSTVVKANEVEAQVVTGIDPRKDPAGAVKALHGFGCKIAVVTLAEAGSIIYDGERLYPIPAYATRAIDPTGAGDTYAAGFMTKYLETPQDLTAVGCFASSVASVMVENSGPDFPLTRAEADRRMETLLNGSLELGL